MEDFEGLTEQLRREIRESMDVFITDARELANKYGGPTCANDRPEVAAALAVALSNQFAAHMMSSALRASKEEGS
jgi:hypothetical protein